jgi:hypothetical protein
VHDDILAERWVALSGIMKAISNVSGLSDKLEKIECELENKVAVSEVRSIGKELATSALDEFQRPLDEKLMAIIASMEAQREKIAALEEGIKTLPEKTSAAPAPAPALTAAAAASRAGGSVSPRNSAPVHAVSEMMAQPASWNPTDMEPLIRDIVNVYLAEWNNGGGDDEGEYYEEEEEEEGVGGHGEPTGEEGHREGGAGVEAGEDGGADGEDANGGAAEQEHLAIDTGRGDQRVAGVTADEDSGTQTSPQASPRAAVPSAKSSPTRQQVSHSEMTDDITSPVVTAKKTAPVPAPQRSAPVNTPTAAASRAAPAVDESSITAAKKTSLPPISTAAPASGPAKKTAPLSPEKPSPQPRPANQVLSKKNSSMSEAPEDSPPQRLRRAAPQGRGGVDPAELAKVKADLKDLQEKLDGLNKSKIDVESVRTLLAQKADTKMVEKKVDNRVVSAIETAVGDVMLQIGNLKDMQQAELEKLKENLARRIKSSLKAVLEEREGASKGAVVSYKGLCMSCGQTSPVPMTSGHTNPPPFLPSLNGSVTPGPEVYRGGFRMPVMNSSTVLGSASDSLFTGEGGFPEYEGGDDTSFHMLNGKPPPSKQGKRMTTPGGPPILSASSSYVEDAGSVRSIHRKGLPGKTSQRAAAAYAPERFELSHAELSSKSAPLVTRLPRTKPTAA